VALSTRGRVAALDCPLAQLRMSRASKTGVEAHDRMRRAYKLRIGVCGQFNKDIGFQDLCFHIVSNVCERVARTNVLKKIKKKKKLTITNPAVTTVPCPFDLLYHCEIPDPPSHKS